MIVVGLLIVPLALAALSFCLGSYWNQRVIVKISIVVALQFGLALTLLGFAGIGSGAELVLGASFVVFVFVPSVMSCFFGSMSRHELYRSLQATEMVPSRRKVGLTVLFWAFVSFGLTVLLCLVGGFILICFASHLL